MSFTPASHPLATQVFGVTLSDGAVTALGVAAILVCIVLSAFFSSSEIAMFSLAKHRLDTLVEEGASGATALAELKGNPHRLLVTILVGNNLVNIAMSSIATGLFAIYLTQGQAVIAATFGITALVLLFGESAPKSYAVENTESWALRIARPLKFAEYALLPLIVTFDYLTRVVNRVTGGRSSIETSYVTRNEIQNMIETGEREGVIEEDEREMLQRIFRFNNTIAKEVMTPRLDMEGVSADADVEEAIQACIQSAHTRLPVYDGSLDNIIGVVNVRDLIRERHYGAAETPELADLTRHPALLPSPTTFTRRIVEGLFRENGLSLPVRQSTNYLETLHMMVSVGLGWSVLPATMLDERVCEIPIPGVSLSRNLGVVRHPARSLSNAARRFLEVLDEYA